MTAPEIFSCVAILLSVFGSTLSLKSYLRDRPHLRITSRVVLASEHGPSRVGLTLANAGRRPLILIAILGSDEAGHWASEYIESQQGVRLGENELHEVWLAQEDTFHAAANDGDADFRFSDLWIEDSLGHRHQVPNAKHLLDQLWDTDRAV